MLPYIVPHRGLHQNLPENSLAAFTAAWAAGFRWCECDVRATNRDGPFLMHDETLERTTTGTGPSRISWNALQKVTLKSPDGQPSVHHIPSLRQVLSALPKKGRLLIELKTVRDAGLVQRVVEEVSDIQGRVILQSFHPWNLEEISRIAPKVRLAILVETADQLAAAIDSRWERVHLEHKLVTADLVQRITGSQRKWSAWTVNRDEDIRRILPMNPEFIISDYPYKVARHRKELLPSPATATAQGGDKSAQSL